MNCRRPLAIAFCVTVASAHGAQGSGDPRLRDVVYDPGKMITLPIKRGMVSLVLLDDDEQILEVAAGLGGDCTKPEAAWCIAAQPAGRTIFVKGKSTATAANNVVVVTDRRTHVFRLVLLADTDPQQPIYRLRVRAMPTPSVPVRAVTPPTPAATLLQLLPVPALPSPSPEELVATRLRLKPSMANISYTVAAGPASGDIVPTLVFDDGRFTYLGFAANADIPAVFHVLPDGSETLLNARMEDGLLVVDRVARHLTLRAGPAVVGVWNEAPDLEASDTQTGTNAPGVERVLKQPGSTGVRL